VHAVMYGYQWARLPNQRLLNPCLTTFISCFTPHDVEREAFEEHGVFVDSYRADLAKNFVNGSVYDNDKMESHMASRMKVLIVTMISLTNLSWIWVQKRMQNLTWTAKTSLICILCCINDWYSSIIKIQIYIQSI